MNVYLVHRGFRLGLPLATLKVESGQPVEVKQCDCQLTLNDGVVDIVLMGGDVIEVSSSDAHVTLSYPGQLPVLVRESVGCSVSVQ